MCDCKRCDTEQEVAFFSCKITQTHNDSIKLLWVAIYVERQNVGRWKREHGASKTAKNVSDFFFWKTMNSSWSFKNGMKNHSKAAVTQYIREEKQKKNYETFSELKLDPPPSFRLFYWNKYTESVLQIFI